MEVRLAKLSWGGRALQEGSGHFGWILTPTPSLVGPNLCCLKLALQIGVSPLATVCDPGEGTQFLLPRVVPQPVSNPGWVWDRAFWPAYSSWGVRIALSYYHI